MTTWLHSAVWLGTTCDYSIPPPALMVPCTQGHWRNDWTRSAAATHQDSVTHNYLMEG